MDFGEQLQIRRKQLNLTQAQLAQKLHVTRQTVSRWETNATYPNLDILVEMSDFLDLSLDKLLKGSDSKMVETISKDVRLKQRYRKWLISIGILFLLLLVFLGVLSWGRHSQNEMIDRFNPFLKTTYGYALLPEKTPTKREKSTITGSDGKRHQKWMNVPQPVNARVVTNPFGDGEWLKFQVGAIPEKGMNYAVVLHKGSYVKRARLVTRSDIPSLIRSIMGQNDQYMPYTYKLFGPKGSWNPFH